jgi:hypothetical protein
LPSVPITSRRGKSDSPAAVIASPMDRRLRCWRVSMLRRLVPARIFDKQIRKINRMN